MDAKKDNMGKVTKESVVDVRRASPYEFCVTAEPISTGGVSVSTGLTYQADVTSEGQQSVVFSVSGE